SGIATALADWQPRTNSCLKHPSNSSLKLPSINFGDRDLDLAAANPLCLRALLEFNEGLVEVPVGDATVGEAHGEARGVGRSYASYAAPIVLLHSCYPFMRETSYLASVYSTVYVDCGLVFSKLSLSGMKAALLDLLDLAPLNKVIMSTDAVGFAEPYYL
ncbi:unnamed protein product, partial [Closterium sp. NIES-53]